jgi:hypothetical protein
MPICERDPWRDQFFENVSCPDGVLVPTDDLDCWPWYPQYNWIYDKLKIATSQGMSCGPHGVAPPSFPVFSKPVINLKGMGLGSRVIATPAEMETHSTPGHFWMPFLEGPHVSTDCALVNGEVQWIRHATGIPWDDGMFKYWTLHAEALPALGGYITTWVSRNMANYTGMMNFETIGGKIIEAHLRFADQWCDMNGEGWIDALVRLYAKGIWQHADDHRQVGYSIPLFAKHNNNFKHPTPGQQARIRSLPEVSSLQITFHENKNPGDHPMPPGGFRLGLINAWNLEAGFAAINELAKCFPEAALLRP